MRLIRNLVTKCDENVDRTNASRFNSIIISDMFIVLSITQMSHANFRRYQRLAGRVRQ